MRDVLMALYLLNGKDQTKTDAKGESISGRLDKNLIIHSIA